MSDLLERVGTGVRLQALVTGRARYHVSAFRTGNDEMLATDLLNLSSKKGRMAFCALLPEDLRTEGEKLAEELAHEAAGHHVSAPKPAAEVGRETVEPWPVTVTTTAMLTAVRDCISRYVLLGEHELIAVSLWVLHTYVTDVTDYTPYIRVYSPVRECGKSTLLEILRFLAHRAQLTGGITAAALYRRIDRMFSQGTTPTMLLDELDTRLKGDSGENLRGVLNTGFLRSGCFTICVGDSHEEKDFHTFCPKVLAGIGRLWDTVTSRSIPIRMERASKDDLAGLGKIRGDRIQEETNPLRSMLSRWANDTRVQLRDTEPDVPGALGARQSDVWRPLLAIAETADDDWLDRARRSGLALHGFGEEEGDYGLLLLEDLRDLLSSTSGEHLPTAAIIEALIAREDRPWAEYRHDKSITPRGVASLLGRFGLKPRTVRVSEGTAKGYRVEDLTPVFRKYLAEKTVPVSPFQSVTSVTSGDPNGTVTNVTDQSPYTGPHFLPSDYEAEEREAIMNESTL